MDLANMISHESTDIPVLRASQDVQEEASQQHHYPTRSSMSSNISTEPQRPNDPMEIGAKSELTADSTPAAHKTVSFEHLVDDSHNVKGRLPMRVKIYPYDSPESIVAYVKDFFGIYDPQGVSFQDQDGKSVIPSYDNFTDNTTICLRATQVYPVSAPLQAPWTYHSTSFPKANEVEEATAMLPPQPALVLNYGQTPSRPMSRVSQRQSVSPKPGQSRSSGNSKSRPRSGIKSQTSSFQAGLDELNDAHNGYSSSDGVAGSVSGSRKARSEQLATAEISVDNILEGGRRKRPKFESSELPLFVPPQIPAPNSISSLSPQRRSNGIDVTSPFPRPTQRTFTYNIPLQSPQGDGYSSFAQGPPQAGSPFQVPLVPSHGHRLRDRSSGATISNRSSLGSGNWTRGHNILPTPDPTVASCISDEDVALQLMRLGDASNFSHGRTSASTFDDGFSGRADAASSATSNHGEESDNTAQPSLPQHRPLIKEDPDDDGSNLPAKRQRRHLDNVLPGTDSAEHSGDDEDGDFATGNLKSEADGQDHADKPKGARGRKPKSGNMALKLPKQPRPGVPTPRKIKQAPISGPQQPMSPASLPPQSRKASVASLTNPAQLGPDEDDLSSKPRCQRCRKSKKGCDRQRPCQRCKDAGIGIEGCISEDEGNGRKGRYGRHMGIAVKKSPQPMVLDNESQAAGAILSGMAAGQAGQVVGQAAGQATALSNKKRKR